ncbi:hypothetical protein [Defluviimonas salinarum]|uniref:Uncharacterized protein n=1 Tax=Defluviimonas salinarum TaxID=2992147 RepID=A0ABT3J612_9RHOB|nr:hypothetical protein [Defluviimonas salinarum]MCW3782890.1 hypothetical protein [Defluviimonas salinarum]
MQTLRMIGWEQFAEMFGGRHVVENETGPTGGRYVRGPLYTEVGSETLFGFPKGVARDRCTIDLAALEAVPLSQIIAAIEAIEAEDADPAPEPAGN